ncbi:MAG: protein kinase domain-containing protein [Bryobacteraceae bacterium]
MSLLKQIKGRYEIRKVLGQGGMGVVYDAYDTVVKRGVALKTIRDIPSRAALDMFYKECDVLASLSHPNIVEIFDIGEFEEDGASKPYFVMPLLPGETLEQLIRTNSSRLTVDRVVEIISQTCRGLQAAHERNLIHRDLKPSNIFVLNDDSVKVIDFGIAHMADTHSTVGHKGTLMYMAPEQIEMKPASALSDIFALGVVCFETLTGRHPFERSSASEVANAILKQIPPPASELNPFVNTMISRVVHKAMAKPSWYRFSSAREFAETLRKASRNEPIDTFDLARLQPRIQRASKAFEQGDFQFADEILAELEAEGQVDPGITALRRQLDQTQRQKMIAQLLDSARTRAEEQEYPLALQKIQELLALDPANGPALALKISIENRRSEQKIDDWFRLARQHMEQNAFSHARQALQDVLQLKPGESRAAQMVAEVDRREQEFVRASREKEELYAKALASWQSGEVSAALSKLEKLVAMDATSGETSGGRERSAAFQSFYNEVRSEHDASKASYEQARRLLVDGKFDDALKICNEQLTRHPGQALFQALKFDVEERRRQELSASIAEVDRQVEAEPDLEKRVHILAETLEKYPGESHLERGLRTMREKRDLVNSIVSKAQAHEERSQFSEALQQWEILRTIYAHYPGLDFEIGRVRRRHDQQVRSDAKAKWVEQIDWQLGVGDYGRAQELLRKASEEFQDDPELAELHKLATQGLARAAEARRLLADGRELCAQRRYEEGMEVLQRAQELDPKDAAIRGALVGTLIEQARVKLDGEWQAADDLAHRALLLDPANAQAKSLRALALDHRREQFVDNSVAQARRLQSDGDLEGALKVVEQGLAEFPRDTRLTQLHATLQKARANVEEVRARISGTATPAQPARFAAEATETVCSPVASPPLPRPTPPVSAAAETIVMPPPVSAAAETIVMPPPQATPAEGAPAEGATALFSAPPPSTPPTSTPAIAPPPTAGLAPPAASKTSTPPPVGPGQPTAAGRPPAAPPPRKGPPLPMIAAGMGALLLLGGGAALLTRSKNAPAPAPAPVVQVPAPVVEPPVNSTLRVFGDVEGGKYTLDDRDPADIEDGQISLDNVPPGQHTLKIKGSREEATIVFSTWRGAAPSIDTLSAKELLAVTVASMGGKAKLRSSSASAKVSVDGKPAGEAGADGLDLTDLSQGNHELTIGEGKDLRSMVLGIGTAPMLTAFLKSDRNVGTLVIVTGEDGVNVLLDGKPYRRQTQRGLVRIPNLFVKDYTVRVAKDGFMDTAEQHAPVRKGEEFKLEFQLKPMPKVASLAIQGAIPGSQVLLDQNVIGTVQDDGSFTASSVPPGEHSIELRKDAYKPRKIEKRFEASQTLQLAAADISLEKLPGTLKLNITPAEAQITVARLGEAPRPVTDAILNLPDGTYTLSASAANYQEKTYTVSLVSGDNKTLDISLPPLAKPAPKALGGGMADWDSPGAWKLENDWYVRKGGDFIGYKPASTNGTFVFTIEQRHGKRLQWEAARTDSRNYVLFQIDKKTFYRAQVVNGKETQLKKIPLPAQKQSAYTIEMDIANGSIVNRLQDGSNWIVLDSWEEPNRAFGNGKFGFYIPGGDEVGLSNFSFAPK